MSFRQVMSLFPLLTANIWALPAQSSLVALNHTVHGRLHAAEPFARACYSDYDGQPVKSFPTQCSALQEQYTSAAYRAEFYSGFMYDQDHICASSQDPLTAQCLLDPTNPISHLSSNDSCGQGSVSTHYIEVSSATDVQAAFAFARDHGITLSIKNSGHDYGSRNSLRGSLALWTRRLQKMEYHRDFLPEGCPSNFTSRYNAMKVGAGVSFNQAYHFADENNSTFVGGSSPTVGASGGFVMTGGHGLLTSQFGLGIDRVLEFKIVTPDGVFRTANACQNQDLYWALRGGGGGTFGVVMESTSKVEPVLPLVFSSINLPSNMTNTTTFTRILMENAIRWSKEGWGGPNGPNFMAMVNPFLSLEEAKESMAPILEYTASQGGNIILETHPTFLSVYEKYVYTTNELGIGFGSLPTNRLIPTELLKTQLGQTQILTYLNRVISKGFTPTIFATTPAYYSYIPGSTSATPAWRNSTWMVTTQTQWLWNSTVAEKKAIVSSLKEITRDFEALAPVSGSYISEADPWTHDWQYAWWGENYPQLAQLKKKYDPKGLLSCWRCVGWDEKLQARGQAFECMGSLN
ncbi:hypothetical protein HYALB_00010832 [Hymenoscyphus albidus]|uniref:FAD-binding PCMH-type domain-containing protein n=1 Tax=Hymenoscyphus albidus TaxID=595503 RepID=A0A9N9LFE1_9HELO|nr:hypothetical protein HYALB_00010832 [Hymenoscyphus albidus]